MWTKFFQFFCLSCFFFPKSFSMTKKTKTKCAFPFSSFHKINKKKSFHFGWCQILVILFCFHYRCLKIRCRICPANLLIHSFTHLSIHLKKDGTKKQSRAEIRLQLCSSNFQVLQGTKKRKKSKAFLAAGFRSLFFSSAFFNISNLQYAQWENFFGTKKINFLYKFCENF